MNIINKLKRKALVLYWRVKNKEKRITIISQNCIGGVIYSDLGLPFQSPTINMFIEDENFLKLTENLEYYMSLDPVAITDNYIDPIDSSISYPKIGIGDIEICALHYKDCNEAIEAWQRRKKRINYNNIVIIGNSWNLHNNDLLIERLSKGTFKTVIFCKDTKPYDGCIKLPGSFWVEDNRGIVRPNLTDFIPNSPKRYFESFFDFIKWINE